MSRRLTAYLYLTLTALIWGFAGVVIKVTLNEISPFVFLLYRFFIVIIVLLPICFFRRVHLPKNGKDLFVLLLLSFFGTTLNLGLLFYGTKFTSVIDQAVITATGPILVVLAGVFFLREHITKREKLGIFATIIGTFVLTIVPFFETKGNGYSSVLGNFLITLANFAWVGYVVLSKKSLRRNMDPILLTTAGFVVGFATMIPLALIEAGSFANIFAMISKASLGAHLGVFYMALLSGALGYFLYQKGQKTIEVSEAALFTYLQAVFTIPFAVVLLNEKLSLPFILGSIIVAAGIVFAELKPHVIK